MFKKNKENEVDEKYDENVDVPTTTEYPNWIGKTVTVPTSDFTGKVKAQKVLKRGLTKNNNSDTILILLFEESSFSCNAEIAKEIV
jgi:flagellar hook assembly protein FlgD